LNSLVKERTTRANEFRFLPNFYQEHGLMAPDPLEDLASSVRGAKGISPADQWNSVSQIISGALLEASAVLQNQGGIDGFVDSLDDLNGAGGVILAIVHLGKRPALIFRPTATGVIS
jgi:hypothetical protein